MAILIILAGLIPTGIFGFLIFRAASAGQSNAGEIIQVAQTSLDEKAGMLKQIEELLASMVEIRDLRSKVKELLIARESLKAERGRVTITQAELETIENRLRELDEISRELEASAVETKEELKILEKKEKELSTKNAQLKQQIADSLSRMEEVFGKMEMSAQLQEQVEKMKSELIRTDVQIGTLLVQIQGGNEQYFILKKRYDALDIEYAQLYEKFSEQQG